VSEAIQSTTESSPQETCQTETAGRASGVFGACIELTKPGITKLVTITALVGLLIGGLHYGTTGVTHWIVLIVGCLIGTSMASGGANALNMWYESDLDALMERTKTRPIPSTRLSDRFVLGFGLFMCTAGSGVLWLTMGLMPALIAVFTAISYVLMYTPLKTKTITNTLIGAVPGALPTMIGTAAVAPGTGFEPLLDPIGLMLFILMFVWQMPHFFAIAWMCRVDYEKGGFRMLPSVDESGNHTAAVMIGSSLLMIPVSLLPMKIIPELSGWVTGGTGIVLGSALVWLSIKFARSRTDKAARTVFFGSIIHLPVYMTVFVAEALIRTVL
jgi:heme o synthase|tara:strand:+ start:85513 stop:86499 length:987 start_codon:yes stop_codon:yes gene_type:complete